LAARRSIDQLLATAGLDAADGVQLVSADRLPSVAFDPSLPLVVMRSDPAREPAASLPGRHARSGARAMLEALYPRHHQLRDLATGRTVALEELDERALAGADWLVPPVAALDNLASPHGMAAISARLRAPDGCPWDRRQTHASLRTYLLEEAYETVDAIERGTSADLAQELGDLLLQVILHAQFAAEEGAFDLTDVYRSIATKIVRRHPHVFGDLEVSSADEVLTNWETIKAAERHEAGKDAGPFADVARVLPALPASREIQDRASALGWDWPSVDGVWEKVAEELDELRGAGDHDDRLHELGDLLFVLVRLGQWLGLDAEESLRAANHRFVDRHRAVQELADARGLDLAGLDAEARDVLWNEAKRG
jgi:tetrapyrrole methylase family protein / MazG family protein